MNEQTNEQTRVTPSLFIFIFVNSKFIKVSLFIHYTREREREDERIYSNTAINIFKIKKLLLFCLWLSMVSLFYFSFLS